MKLNAPTAKIRGQSMPRGNNNLFHNAEVALTTRHIGTTKLLLNTLATLTMATKLPYDGHTFWTRKLDRARSNFIWIDRRSGVVGFEAHTSKNIELENKKKL